MYADDFNLGCNKQKEDPRDRIYKPKAVHWTELNDIDMRAGCPPVRSQGSIGSCTAFAATALFDFVRRKHDSVLWAPSPLFTYYATRLADKTENKDSGASVRDALKSTMRDGVAMERLWPYIPSKYTLHPPQEAWDDAEKHQTLEYLKLDDFDKNVWLNCLNEGYPFIFGLNLYPSFFDSIFSMLGGYMQDPDRENEKLVGAHCMMAVGYLKNYNGKEYLIVQNSWGREWGSDGYCYIPLSYIMSNDSFDFWTIRLTEIEKSDEADPLPEPPAPEPVVVVEPVKPPEPDVAPVPEPPAPIPEPVVPAIIPEEIKPKLNWGLTFVLVALGTMLLIFLFS